MNIATDSTSGASASWSWRRIPRIGAGPVVTQLDENACGPACGEMLLRDRGYSEDQRLIAGDQVGPFSERQLAMRLSWVSKLRWIGGVLDLPGDPSSEDVTDLCSKGSWAALLLPGGHRYVGHWVVVDGISPESVILVRDPVGQAYGMLASDFLPLWSYTVHVSQEISR